MDIYTAQEIRDEQAKLQVNRSLEKITSRIKRFIYDNPTRTSYQYEILEGFEDPEKLAEDLRKLGYVVDIFGDKNKGRHLVISWYGFD